MIWDSAAQCIKLYNKMRVTQDLLWKTEYLKHSTVEPMSVTTLLKGGPHMRGNLSPMISANAWVESHVAYHSLEGRTQMIGSFITLPRAN